MDILKGHSLQEVKAIILRYGGFEEGSHTTSDAIADVFGITRSQSITLLEDIARDSPAFKIVKETGVSMHGGNAKSPIVKFSNLTFPSNIEDLLAKVESIIYSGIGVELDGLLTMFSKRSFIVGSRMNLFANELILGFVKDLFPEMALAVRTRAAGNRSSYSAALGALTFCPKAELHLKIGTCVVVADSDESPLRQWDMVQMWSASSNEVVLMDLDRAKTFHLDDTSFNVVEEVDLWRRHQPQGGYFGPTMKIHRLPYKSSESKLIQAEASDVGFAREMEIGGIVHALEDFRGCSITGCVSPRIGSLNLISEILYTTNAPRQKWRNDGEKAAKCRELGNIAADILSFIKKRRTPVSSN